MRVVESFRTCWQRSLHNRAARRWRYTPSAHNRTRQTPAHHPSTQAAASTTRRNASQAKPTGKPTPKRPWKPAHALVDRYSSAQSRRPYLTQLCLTPLIYCIGDFAAQTISDDDRFHPHHSWRSLVIGLVIAIPSHEWFLFLGRRFNYRSAALSLALKVAVHQLVYTPLFNVYFFAFHAILAGNGVGGAVDRVKNTVPVSLPRSVLYWPLVTAFNFTYVQPQSRAVATSVFAVFWQSYLSWLNRVAGKGPVERSKNPSGVVEPSAIS